MAKALFDILAGHEQTAERLGEAVLEQFEVAGSFAEAKILMALLEQIKLVPKARLRVAESAVQANVDLREAHSVPERFHTLLRKHGLQPTAA